jgi:hypothetical protein
MLRPESFAESRFCLSRPVLFFGAVREHARARILVDLEGDCHAESRTLKIFFAAVLIALAMLIRIA